MLLENSFSKIALEFFTDYYSNTKSIKFLQSEYRRINTTKEHRSPQATKAALKAIENRLVELQGE